MIRIPKNRPATHPGEILLEDFLRPMGLTQTQLAQGIRVPFQRVNEIISGKRGLTPSTAFGWQNTSEFARLLAESPDALRSSNG